MGEKAIGLSDAQSRLLDAALPHVAFDGWSEATFRAAAQEAGIATDLARVLCPRGALDLAVAYHRRGDREMISALRKSDVTALRFREKVALAVRLRLAGAERDVVRRGAAIFALPQNAATGIRLVWDTADAIWTELGDTSDDFNWYSKRATLAAVYSSVVLFWLGDDSEGQADTWAFLDRRIADVMRFETLKARLRDDKRFGPVLKGPLSLLSRIRAPSRQDDRLPGAVWRRGG